jgi:hypothetical protein
MVNRTSSLLALGALLLSGCSTPPQSPPAPVTSARLPFPTYVTHASALALGGASWRGGRTEHALDPDGQACGIGLDGRAHCWQSVSDPLPAAPQATPQVSPIPCPTARLRPSP